MEIIDKLNATTQAILPYFDLSSEDLLRTYAPGKWNIKQILVHLSDAESVMLYRIRKVICEPGQVIWAFNQDVWCEKLRYTDYPIMLSKSEFLSNRQSIQYLAKLHYATSAELHFVHSETGLRTLKNEFDKIVAHSEGHLSQIKNALL